MPNKLWTVIAAKTIVHDDKAAIHIRRYIAADYIMCIMLHNCITQGCIILHPAAKRFDWGAILGIPTMVLQVN